MTDERKCGTCKHWTEDVGYGDSPRLLYRVDGNTVTNTPSDGDYDAHDARQALITNQYRICTGVPFTPAVFEGDELPLALTIDGSEYRADLRTRAEFSCAAWEVK